MTAGHIAYFEGGNDSSVLLTAKKLKLTELERSVKLYCLRFLLNSSFSSPYDSNCI
ncbi:MAG: hypothetical protein ACTSSG_13565 [Candidatus Heimdallarchaeaceae archaeon]